MDKNFNLNKEKLFSAILNSSGAKIDKDALKRAEKGDVSAIMAGLTPQDRQSLSSALSDPEKAKAILTSKQTRELLKGFLKGGEKNG